jgi:hypothetical protein
MSILAFPTARRGPTRDRQGAGRARFEGATVPPLHAASHQFIAYCRSQRAEDGRLHRAAIAPARLPRLLPYLFIAEPSTDGWRYRLFGTMLAERLGAEMTGRTTAQIFEPDTAAEVDRLYDRVAAGDQPVTRRGRFFGLGPAFLMIESTQYPMVARNGWTPMVFGCLFFFVLHTTVAGFTATAEEVCRQSGL